MSSSNNQPINTPLSRGKSYAQAVKPAGGGQSTAAKSSRAPLLSTGPFRQPNTGSKAPAPLALSRGTSPSPRGLPPANVRQGRVSPALEITGHARESVSPPKKKARVTPVVANHNSSVGAPSGDRRPVAGRPITPRVRDRSPSVSSSSSSSSSESSVDVTLSDRDEEDLSAAAANRVNPPPNNRDDESIASGVSTVVGNDTGSISPSIEAEVLSEANSEEPEFHDSEPDMDPVDTNGVNEILREQDGYTFYRYQDCGFDEAGRPCRYDVSRHLIEALWKGRWVPADSISVLPSIPEEPHSSHPTTTPAVTSARLNSSHSVFGAIAGRVTNHPASGSNVHLDPLRTQLFNRRDGRPTPADPINSLHRNGGYTSPSKGKDSGRVSAYNPIQITPTPPRHGFVTPNRASSTPGRGTVALPINLVSPFDQSQGTYPGVSRTINSSEFAKLSKLYREKLEKHNKKLSHLSSTSDKALTFLTIEQQIRKDAQLYNPTDPAGFATDAFQELVTPEAFAAFQVMWSHAFSSDLDTQMELIGAELFKVMLAKSSSTELLGKKTFVATKDSVESHIISTMNLSMLAQVSPVEFIRYLTGHWKGHSISAAFEQYMYVSEGKKLLADIYPSQNIFSADGLQQAVKIVLLFAEGVAPLHEGAPSTVMALQPTDNRTCYKCQEEGHIARNCTNNRKEKSPSSKSAPDSPATPKKDKKDKKGDKEIKGKDSGKKGTCTYCNKIGHAAKVCRSRIRNEGGNPSPAKRQKLDDTADSDPIDTIMAMDVSYEKNKAFEKIREAVGVDTIKQMFQRNKLTPISPSKPPTANSSESKVEDMD